VNRRAYHLGVSFARDERAALCAVLRERRPDAAAGIIGGPLAGYTRRVQRALTAGTSFRQLVEEIRNGPPAWSVFRIPGMDDRLNMVEYFVHHEDVRRAADGWEPRDIGGALAQALWQRLRNVRLVLRRAPVGVELVRDDLPANHGQQQVRITAKASTPVVTVIGSPAELTLWALGRTTAARVRYEGSEPDVSRLARAGWRR
jgi:uncharacterized protein (TIGR03085 family)